MSYAIDTDVLYPRDESHRWRIYARRGKELDVIAVADSPGGIGEALVQIDLDERARERRLSDLGAIGVLDVVDGYWLLLPWHRPDQNATSGNPPTPLRQGDRWVGQVVRSRTASGQLWRVGRKGRLGYRLTPVGGSGLARPLSRTERELDAGWEVVIYRGETQ